VGRCTLETQLRARVLHPCYPAEELRLGDALGGLQAADVLARVRPATANTAVDGYGFAGRTCWPWRNGAAGRRPRRPAGDAAGRIAARLCDTCARTGGRRCPQVSDTVVLPRGRDELLVNTLRSMDRSSKALNTRKAGEDSRQAR